MIIINGRSLPDGHKGTMACRQAANKMTTTERMTAQKKFIMDYLMSVKSHPTAEIIYEEVRKKLPNISQGTVYRVLNNLKKTGQIQAIDTKETVHFDGDISDHAHFICENCNRVYDVFEECSKCGILKSKKTKVGKIKKYQIKFYGICRECNK